MTQDLCKDALARQYNLIELLIELQEADKSQYVLIDEYFHPDFKGQIVEDAPYEFNREEIVRQACDATALDDPIAFVCKKIDDITVQIDFKIIYHETKTFDYRSAVWRLHEGVFKQYYFFTETTKELLT